VIREVTFLTPLALLENEEFPKPNISAQEFDDFWQGRGGSDMMVQAIPSDHVPFAPSMYSSDVLLVQTEGVQHVTLYDLGDDDLAEGVLCSYVTNQV
jgi:hypothetical protein